MMSVMLSVAFFIVMLSVIMLNIVILSDVMLNLVMMSVMVIQYKQFSTSGVVLLTAVFLELICWMSLC